MIGRKRRRDAALRARPYFFLHLQKTAGTALWKRLKHQYDESEIFPGPGDGAFPNSVLVVDNLVERWRLRGGEIKVVTGHFPLCTTELLGAQFTTLTIVRDPIERTLSALRHHREKTPADQDKSLEEIYEEPFRFELVHNHMVKMLSLTVDEMQDGALTHVEFTPERLARAKQRLAEIDAVGLQENFDDFCAQLTRRFGWNLGPPQFANRTQPVDVDAAFRNRIASDNADDIELYEFARARFSPRRR
jgi:hypothetical protein